MMIMVDTTVWIDFFAARSSEQVTILETLIAEKANICICGIILSEVLQGIRSETEFRKTQYLFNSLIFLPMTYSTFVKSADIYRDLRKKGITIRKSVDCMIAAVAIEHDIKLLHNDRDFYPIEKHCGLKTVEVTIRK